MRILHVITSLHIGGAERLMTILLPKLRDLGNDVELLVFDGSRTAFTESLEKNGIKIHSLNSKRVYSLSNIFKLRKFIKLYDIIHTHNTACQLFVPIAGVLTLKQKTKFITTEHNTNNRRRDKVLFKPIDRWMYRQYESIICVGESTQFNLVNYIGSSYNTCVIHNGIQLPPYSVILSKGKDKIVISMVAAFRQSKDQDSLVKAMTKLPDKYCLQLIGDGERRSEVENLVKELGISERVSFLGNRSDINELLSESYINVLSSHWEGLSLTSLESMAVGRPFIASDVQGLREIVDGFGVLFPDGDYNALAAKILDISSDKELYNTVAKKCRERAEQFDIAKTAEEYHAVYNKCDI